MDLRHNHEIYLRLAHFNPDFKDKFGNQILDYLLLDSLSSCGPLIMQSVSDIAVYIRNAFGLEFEDAEIIASGRRLAQKEIIEINDSEYREDYPTFKILPGTQQKIQSNVTKTLEIENCVYEEWKQELKEKYNNHPKIVTKLDELTHLLQVFLSKLLQRHGVECVALLYPKDRKATTWFENLGADILEEILPDENFLKSIFQIEVASFFRSDNEVRRHYITSLLNSSYFWHLIQVDDEFTESIKTITSGQKLFLDANILYNLVGLTGQNSYKAINNLIDFAKQLNYRIYVTTKTIDEFQYSVNRKFSKLQSKPPIPRDLAKIAAEQLDEDSILACYWREYAESNRSIEDFISDKIHITSVLKRLGISIYDKYRDEIEASKELKDEESILRNACGNHFNQHIVEHDAFHRILINKLRKRPKLQFHKAVAWFLTQDSKLNQYSKVARKGVNSLPFCITSNLWIQINRPLLPRTNTKNEFEESFYLLVTRPYIRSITSSFSLDDAYERVMSQLGRYNNMNPQFALNVVADRHFLITLALENDQEKVDEKLNNRFIDVANELILEKSEVLEKYSKAQREIKKIESEKASYEEQIEGISNSAGRMEAEIQTLKKEKASNKQVFDQTLEKMEKKLENQKSESDNDLKQLKNKFTRWVIFSVLFLICSIFLWFNDVLIRLNWIELHKNKIYVQVLFQVVILFSLLNIPLYKYWERWLTAIISSIIAILMLSKL